MSSNARSEERTPRLVVVLVIALGVVVWGNTLRFDYTLDDRGIVYENRMVERFDLRGIATTHLRAGSNVEEEPDSVDFLYRPIPLLTFALDRRIGGGRPAIGHFTNVVLHFAATGLAWLLLRRLRVPVPVAATAAALFLLHPVHVEAVANIKHREEILAAIGIFGAWLCVERALDAGSARARGLLSLAGGAALLLALLSKESAVFALVAIPLASVVLRAGNARRFATAVAVHLPLLAAVAAWLAIRDRVIGAVTTVGTEIFFLPQEGFATRLLTSAKVWASYYVGRGLLAMSCPVDFSSRCEVTIERGWPSLAAIAGLGILAASIVGAVVAWRRGRRDVAYWCAFFWLALGPTSNLVVPIGSVGAFRFLYVPALGAFVLAAWALVALSRAAFRGAAAGRVLWSAVVVVAAVLAIASSRASRDWRDDVALNRSDLRRTSNPRARYIESTLVPDAAGRERWLREVVRIMEGIPGSGRGMETTLLAKTYTELAEIELTRGDLAASETLARKALAVLEADDRFLKYAVFPRAVLARIASARGRPAAE